MIKSSKWGMRLSKIQVLLTRKINVRFFRQDEIGGGNQQVGPIDLDALIEYFQNLDQPFSASVEGRIERLN
jgi:hypothetical protein